jgi:hypothetical protein
MNPKYQSIKKFTIVIGIIAILLGTVFFSLPTVQLIFDKPEVDVYIDSKQDSSQSLAFNELNFLIKTVGGEVREHSWTELENIANQIILIAHGTPQGIKLQNGFLSWQEFDTEISKWQTHKIIVLACYSGYSSDFRVVGADGVIDAGLAAASVGISILPILAQFYYNRLWQQFLEKHLTRIFSTQIFPLADTESGYEYAFQWTKSKQRYYWWYIYERTWWINMIHIPLDIATLTAFITLAGFFLPPLAPVIAFLCSLCGVVFASLAINYAARGYKDIKFGFTANTVFETKIIYDMGTWNLYVPAYIGPLTAAAYEAFGICANQYGWGNWIEVWWYQ